MLEPVTAFFRLLRNMLGKVWWVFPLVMLGGGLLVPSLQLTVTTWPIPEEHAPSLPWWLLADVILGVLWVVSGFFHASNTDTGVSALKADTFISTVLFGLLAALSGWLAAKNLLAWAVVVPAVAAMADAFITGDRAINNAAQKPIVQQSQKGV